jgi:hypothetical protein
MASLSGLTSLSCDKLTIRKPRPSLEKLDVFQCFIQNPEGFSRFEPTTQAWNPLDNAHVPGTLDMYTHTSASVSGLFNQILEIRTELGLVLDGLRGEVSVLQTQTATLQQQTAETQALVTQVQTQLTSQDARITALEGRVEDEEQQTGGIWAHIESILGWINFIGGMLQRIEEILVTLGLL